MTKRNYRHLLTCVGCGAELVKTNGNMRPFCQESEECGMAFAKWYAYNNVDKVGDCEVWRGRPKGGETFRVRLRINGKNLDPRVLDLRAGDTAVGKYKRYRKLCDTPGCVVLEHHEAAVAASTKIPMTINAHLPAEPLVEYFEKNLRGKVVLSDAPRENFNKGRRQGYFTVSTVDALCIDCFGIHPAAIYGDLFWEAA